MKRILSLFAAFALVFILGACDLIPTEVVDLSEELCRENPDNELCDIENLTDIEENVVKDLVIKAVEDIKAGNTETCDEIFAITNTVLLDDCKNAAESIYPSDVETFEFVEVVKDGETYTIKGTIGTEATVEVKVSVGEVEGNLRITSWQFTKTDNTDPDPDPDPVTDEEFIKQMILAYLDDDVDNDTLSVLYFNNMLDADFKEGRSSDLLDNLEITVLSISMDTTGLYKIEIETKSDVNMTPETGSFEVKVIVENEIRYLELLLDGEDNDCDGVVCEPEDDLEAVKLFLEDFFLKFYDPQVANEALYDYFDVVPETGIERDFTDLEGVDIDVDIDSLMMGTYENEYVLTISYTFGMDVQIIEVPVVVIPDGDSYKIKYDDIDDDCDGIDDCVATEFVSLEDATAFYQSYFTMYSDASLSHQEFANMYLAGELTTDFIEQRTNDLEAGRVFELVELVRIGDNKFDVEYKYQDGNDIVVRKRPGRIRTAPDALVAEWDEMFMADYVTDPAEALEFFNQFIVDYFDETLTNEDLHALYFQGLDYVDILESRQNDLISGLQVSVLEINQLDDFAFDLRLEMLQDGERHEEHIRIKIKRIDAATPLLIIDGEDNDCDGVEECYYEEIVTNADELFMLWDMFFDLYNDVTVSNEELSMYFMGEYFELLENRNYLLEMGTTFQVLDIVPNEYDPTMFFDVHIEARNGDTSETTVIRATVTIRFMEGHAFIIGGNGIDDDCNGTDTFCEVEYDAFYAKEQLQVFMDMFNDPSILTDDLWMYTNGYNPLLEERYEGKHNDVVWTVVDVIDEYGDGWFLFVLESADGIVHRDIAARVIYTEDSFFIEIEVDYYEYCDLYPEDCYFDPLVKEIDHASDIFTRFLLDFINPDILFEEILEMYFMNEEPEFLRMHREFNLVDGLTVEITGITYNNVDSFFDISYKMVGPGFEQAHMVTVRLFDYEGLYYIEYFDETNECHVTPENCYYEVGYETNLEIIEPFLQDLFMMVNSPDFDTEMIQMYFGWMAPEMILNAKMVGGTVQLISVYPSQAYPSDSFFDIMYLVELPDGDVFEEQFTAQFAQYDGLLQIELKYFDYCETDPMGCYYEVLLTDPTTVEGFVNELFMKINDPTISDDITMYYFTWAPEPIYLSMVERSNAEVLMIEETAEGLFTVYYMVEYADGTMLEDSFTAAFYQTQYGVLIYVERPYELDAFEELLYTVEMLFGSVGYTDIPVEELCYLFTDTTAWLCQNIYQFHADNMYNARIEELYVSSSMDMIEVFVVTYDSDGVFVEENHFSFALVTDSPLFEAKTTSSNNPLYQE